MLLRNIHTQITEEHGIPYWGSYLLFALATIIIGAVLGLVLVFLIDCIYPNKAPSKRSDMQLPAQSDTQVCFCLKNFLLRFQAVIYKSIIFRMKTKKTSSMKKVTILK